MSDALRSHMDNMFSTPATDGGMRTHLDNMFTIPEQGMSAPVAAPVPVAAPAPAGPWVDPYTQPEFIGGTDAERAALLKTAGSDPSLAPLQLWLTQTQGGFVPNKEMYDYWHGDEILKQLQKYDPNARVVQVADSSGGEGGGGSGVGWKFEFDQSKLPAMGPAGYNVDWAPANRELRNPNLVYNDPIYGPLTPRQNIAKQKDPWWVTAAPLAVAGLATAGAAIPALAAGGVAGGTAGVTGGAAGLAAGNIASGIGNTWWSQILSKAPQLARMATPPTATPWTPPAPAAPAVPNQFNAANFNNTGSMAKPGSNDSALVATQFAADPYGASQQ